MKNRTPAETAAIRTRLVEQRQELAARITRIHAHARDPLEADSSEQAAQLGNVAVVSALETEGTEQILAIDAALRRLESGTWGMCTRCGEPIDEARLRARPASTECVGCA